MKVSKKQLRKFAAEEKETARLYARLGFRVQARQEAAHARFFRRELRRLR